METISSSRVGITSTHNALVSAEGQILAVSEGDLSSRLHGDGVYMRLTAGPKGTIAAISNSWSQHLLIPEGENTISVNRIDLPAVETAFYSDGSRLYAYLNSPWDGNVGLYEILL